MSVVNKYPTYNLKAVLKKTGLKADVLRAWERRYDLPRPHRTLGGHRLYSEYDIESVKWLRAQKAEGLSISRAVMLWHAIIEAGNDPLAVESSANTPPHPDRLLAADTRIDILRQNWIDANLAFDSAKADDALNQAFAIHPVEMVCAEILQQGIKEIGNDWYLGKASVQQEHFATALASHRIAALITATPRPTRPVTVLVGCPPGERHTFSVLLITLFLRRRGMDVVYLGADIPINKMAETIEAIQPNLIVLAAQQLVTAASLQSTAIALQGNSIHLAYGGLIFNRVPQLRKCIPLNFLGETLDNAMQQIELMVAVQTPFLSSVRVDEIYRETARLFREKRTSIENGLFQEHQRDILSSDHLGEANSFFGDGLLAALELGDLEYFEPDLDWMMNLLASRQNSTASLVPYLSAYSQATTKVMGKVSALITDWINSYLAKKKLSNKDY